MQTMRIDVYLTEQGFAESRQKAKNMLEAGNIFINGEQVRKASFRIPDGEEPVVEVRGEVMPYVSRGGLKLAAALQEFSVRPEGLRAVDFGASTGGFTDCLLQNGAALVYAVDSGRGQLHPKLAADPRVVSMEGFNARNLTLGDIGGVPCDIAVADLSFISQTKIYDAVSDVLKEGGRFISLIKPQFEAGRAYLNKNGIVTDRRVHERVCEMIRAEAFAHGLMCRGMTTSPIEGGDGNREYLALFVKESVKRDETENRE